LCSRGLPEATVATTARQATAALMAAPAAALLTVRPAPVVALTPREAAAIPRAEVTTNRRLASKVVGEVKVRGRKGVLNGTPFSFPEGL
jgi:hypothetical protein